MSDNHCEHDPKIVENRYRGAGVETLVRFWTCRKCGLTREVPRSAVSS